MCLLQKQQKATVRNYNDGKWIHLKILRICAMGKKETPELNDPYTMIPPGITILRKGAADMNSKGMPMIVVGIAIGALYWFIDSILCVFMSNDFYFFQELFSPDLTTVYRRLVVICLFVVFGSHTQSQIAKREQEVEEWIQYSQEVGEDGQEQQPS